MQVNNNSDHKAIDPSKEAQKANQTKINPNKHAEAQKPSDPVTESERMAKSAANFNKGLSQPAQSTQQAHDATKVEQAQEAVKAEAFRREREKSVKA